MSRKTKKAVREGKVQVVPKDNVRPWLITVLVAMAFFAVVRLRVADVPLERDEGEYAYAGQLILQGLPPYQLAYNMKFPGTYYAYSAIMAVFGETPWGIHVGLLLVNGATVLMMFMLGRTLFADSMGSAVAAISFGLLSLDLGIMGVFAHATHFVIFPAVAGLLVLRRVTDSKSVLSFAFAGALLGLSVLMKQNGIFFFVLGLCWLVWDEWNRAPFDGRLSVRRGSAFLLGAALPVAALLLLLTLQGVFGKFWFWTIQYAREYVSEVSLAQAWQNFERTWAGVAENNAPLWLLAVAGLPLLWVVRWPQNSRFRLTALLLLSLLAVSPGLYFRHHYFILLLPAAGLFSGVAAMSLERWFRGLLPPPGARVAAFSVLLIAAAAYTVSSAKYLFSMPPDAISRTSYGANPFVESPEIARYIQQHSEPADRIAVLGSEPQIYFYANRRSATGHIYTYGLMEKQRYSMQMQDEMIQEITAVHPKYLVFVGISASWLGRDPNEKILVWSQAYMNQCYEIVGVTEVSSTGPAHYVWDTEAAAYQPQTGVVIHTLRRKSDAPCSVSI